MKLTAETQSPIADDHPMKVAWDAYKQTDEYANSKHWALRIAPIYFDADERRQAEDLMPHSQREQHVEGSLWVAFCEGYRAALSSTEGEER